MNKPKVAIYWASSCTGCDNKQVEIGSWMLKLPEPPEIIFWPSAVDKTIDDISKISNNSIDVCLINANVQNPDQEHVVKTLREKSRIAIVYGVCAYLGGIPGLASSNRKNYARVKPISQVIKVDYTIPGCPPDDVMTKRTLEAVLKGALPPKDAAIYATAKSLCDDCGRKRNGITIKNFHATIDIVPDPSICLLEQGLICSGVATVSGCGATCPQSNMPCAGCYGALEGVTDQGAHLLSAIASMLDDKPEEIKKAIDNIVNPNDSAFNYALPRFLLNNAGKNSKTNPSS